MSSSVEYEAVRDDLHLEIDETQAYTEPAPSRQKFITRMYALFAGQILLVNLFVVLFLLNDGLVAWMFSTGRFVRFAIFLSSVVAAGYLAREPGQYRQSAINTTLALTMFSLCQAHELGLLVVLAQPTPMMRLPVEFLFVPLLLGAISKLSPDNIQRIPHYLLSSKFALPALSVALVMLGFESLQFEVARLLVHVMFVLMVVFYTQVAVERYGDERLLIASVELYYNVILRSVFVLFCIAVVVNKFT
ncbi:hypothetical protein IWW50_000435 [Coemansia erecta]|nr:hypothetical protein GGF43_001070 [Coemansia sp. RSA 2618]KAJ2830171.1 hypothetical protein IWW50_000435 [Coemansia erecta]